MQLNQTNTMKTTKTRKPLCIGARMMLLRHFRKFNRSYVVYDTRNLINGRKSPGVKHESKSGVITHKHYIALPDNSSNRSWTRECGWNLLARITDNGLVLLKGQRAPKPKPRLSLVKTPQKPANVTGPVFNQIRHPRVTQLPPAPGYNSPVVHI